MEEEVDWYDNIKYYFYQKDSENKLCADCKAILPGYLSINNGIFICKNCAKIHKENLPNSISYIKSLEDELDEFLLSFIERGGNKRFLHVTNTYHLTEMDITKKYKTKILENYRQTLKSEILCEEPPKKVSFEEALEELNESDISESSSEFNDYKLYKYQDNISNDGNANSSQPKIYNKILEVCTDPEVKKMVYDGSVMAFNFAKGVLFTGKKVAKKCIPYVTSLINQAADKLNEFGEEENKSENEPENKQENEPENKPENEPKNEPEHVVVGTHDDFHTNKINDDFCESKVLFESQRIMQLDSEESKISSDQSLPSFSKVMEANENIDDNNNN